MYSGKKKNDGGEKYNSTTPHHSPPPPSPLPLPPLPIEKTKQNDNPKSKTKKEKKEIPKNSYSKKMTNKIKKLHQDNVIFITF